MNLIPKICEMLGVEVGEEFKLHWNGVEQTGIFRFTNYRLESKFKDKEDWGECSVLPELLNGGITIIKLPFEPKEGEQYQFIGLYDEKPTVMFTIWHDAEMEHYERKYCGNVFRNRKDAEDRKYEIYEKLTGKTWEE